MTSIVNYEEHKNIGIDDFSTLKREKYCTIITDNDSKTKINIIQNRDKDSVVKELKKFTNVETITRDFSITYKASIEEALPNTKQIVDRFHILKNYTDDMLDYMKRILPNNIKMNDASKQLNEEEVNTYDRNKLKTAEKKWNLICQVKELKKQKMSNIAIGTELGICDETVAKYLKIDSLPIQESHSKIDDYIPDIKEQILEGKTKQDIYQYIKTKGYTGKESILYHRLKSIRAEVKKEIVSLKRSQLKKIFFVDDVKEIKGESIRTSIQLYLQQDSKFNTLVTLFREFKIILFSKKENDLDAWIEKAKKEEIDELTKFINLIESDISAVKNAITYDYSNGLTEGFNNKTKVIKREMYGRCSFNLLRIKILA